MVTAEGGVKQVDDAITKLETATRAAVHAAVGKSVEKRLRQWRPHSTGMIEAREMNVGAVAAALDVE